MNILAVGAHPDDIELGCFGTLASYRSKNHKIFGAIITNGELQGNPSSRKKEAKKAAKLIDMKLFFGNFQDGNLTLNSSFVSFLDKLIEENQIDVLFSHSTHDRHEDHNVVGKSCISASRNVNELYFYETPSVLYPFKPQLFFDVTDSFDNKILALKKHKTQRTKGYMRIEAIKGLAKFRGFQSGHHDRLCEAFEIQKIFKS